MVHTLSPRNVAFDAVLCSGGSRPQLDGFGMGVRDGVQLGMPDSVELGLLGGSDLGVSSMPGGGGWGI